MPEPYLSPQLLLTTLVGKLAVVALLSIVLVRYHRFRAILLSERRAWPDRLVFASSMGVPLAVAVAMRVLLNYEATDLTLEGTFVAGLIAGPYAGALVGLLAGLPPTFAREWGALPFAVGCGFAGGGLRELCPKEAIWRFSPFVFTTLLRRLWKMVRSLELDWQIILVLAPVGMEMIRLAVGRRWGAARLFYLPTPAGWMTLATMIATILAVAIFIKIWNTARVEHQLEEQEKLLMAARIEALSSQISPHFLFNALNSITSLIRSDPETARVLVVKLSALLRQRLKSREHFTTLSDELESIDQYLDIEVVRFGSQLQVAKAVAPDTLDTVVPSMILQPLVENSIKHGLARKVGGGTITIRAFREGTHTVIEVLDDGFGMTDERLASALTAGIGLSNVDERLRVTYGDHCRLKLSSTLGQGTCARIEIPEQAAHERLSA